MKVKVVGSNPGYLYKSFLLYQKGLDLIQTGELYLIQPKKNAMKNSPYSSFAIKKIMNKKPPSYLK